MHRRPRRLRLALVAVVAPLLLVLAPAVSTAAEDLAGASNLRPGDAVASATQLPIRWDAASGATQYEVQVFVAGMWTPSFQTLTTSTSVVATGLAPDTQYFVVVTARHGAEEGPSTADFFETLKGAPSAFGDVPTNHVFAYHMQWLAAEGVTKGYGAPPNLTFQPSAPVLREQMAAFLYRLAGEPEFDAPTTSPFLDVSTAHVFYREIAWLADAEITTGYDVPGGKEFRPSQPVLREQMAAFLFRYAGEWTIDPEEPTFTDVPTTHRFFSEIEWLADRRVSTGYDEAGGTRTFRGSQPVLREQMAAFLYRYEVLPTAM